MKAALLRAKTAKAEKRWSRTIEPQIKHSSSQFFFDIV
jgi:hypothetical protein